MEEALEIYLLSYFRVQHINSLPHRYQTINKPVLTKGFPATKKMVYFPQTNNMGNEKKTCHMEQCRDLKTPKGGKAAIDLDLLT